MVRTDEPVDARGMEEGTATMDADPMDEQRDDEQGGPLPPPVPPPPGTTASWWLTPVARDPDAGHAGGVVAGLCRSYGFDLKTTRIALVIASLVLPAIILLYVAAWVLLPPRPEQAVPLRDVVVDRRRLPLMIAIGIALAVGSLGSFGSWFLFGGLPWGVGLIALGVLLWAAPNIAWRSRTDVPTQPLPPMGSVAGHRSAPSSFAPTPYASLGIPPMPEPTRPACRWVPVVPIAIAVAWTMVAIASIGDALDWWDASVLGVTIAFLAILQAGIVLGAIVNRSWIGLPFFLLLAVPMAFLLITQPNLDGGIGKRTHAPTTLEQAQQPQSLGVGELTLDLSGVPATEGSIAVRAEVGIGRLHVIVPDDVVIELTSELGAGHLVIEGDEISSGLRQSAEHSDSPSVSSNADRRVVALDLEVGAGEIAVDRSAGGEG
jgi:phage shock protein PspC (stress-responsive transcriptional regulator)